MEKGIIRVMNKFVLNTNKEDLENQIDILKKDHATLLNILTPQGKKGGVYFRLFKGTVPKEKKVRLQMDLIRIDYKFSEKGREKLRILGYRCSESLLTRDIYLQELTHEIKNMFSDLTVLDLEDFKQIKN